MRSEYCGLVSRKYLNQTVTVYGWVHRRRDHGGVIFVDLRDREGLVQVVCDPDRAATFAVAESLRNEQVEVSTAVFDVTDRDAIAAGVALAGSTGVPRRRRGPLRWRAAAWQGNPRYTRSGPGCRD